MNPANAYSIFYKREDVIKKLNDIGIVSKINSRF